MIQQVTLKGEPSESWEGVCCKACYFAKLDKCTCKCKGKFHGKGNKGTPVESPLRHKGRPPFISAIDVSVCEDQPKETTQ